MQLAEEKIFRIGVDWLSLHNFEIECDERIGKLEETTESYYRERILIEEPIFTIDSSTKLYADGTIKEYRNLRFNPNRILYEDNIQNADSQDIVAALKKLEKILLAKGIKLDITNATVSAIEINLNIKKEFSELMETLVLLFAKTPNLKKISGFKVDCCFNELFQDETLKCRWKTYEAIAYCKNSEMKFKNENENFELGIPITRLEWRFQNSVYKYFCKKFELDSTLKTLLENFEIIENMFREYCKREMFEKAFKVIDTQIRPNLVRGYKEFKNSNKLGKEIGKKQKRDVYKYLEENYWIFDTAFLKEVVEEYDKKNKNREFERIDRKMIHHDNLKKLDYLVNIIFPH